METTLSKLYRQIVFENKEQLHQDPAYQDAIDCWMQVKDARDPIPLEDGKDLLLEVWGRISFSAGFKLGLSISQELNAIFPDE